MKTMWTLWSRLTGLFRKNWREREMAEEFQSHLQMHIDDNIRAGMSPDQARREALVKFGGMETAKESMRETSRLIWIETIWQDLRYSLRGLRLNPGFAATAVLSLALGIGASVAIYTVGDNLLLRPLPYPGSSELAMVWENNLRNNNVHNVVSPGNYFDWKKQNSVFENIGGFVDFHVVLGDGKRSEEVDAQAVSSEVLPLLRVQPVRGRVFTYGEDAADAHAAIISYRLWQNWFGGDESALGRQIQVNARPFTIIGVLPPDFYFHTRSIDVWLTLGLNFSSDLRKKQGRWLLSVARLKPGVSFTQAQAEMTGIGKRLEIAYPEFDKNWGINVEPLRDSLIGQVKPSLLALLGAVTLLLAVACANVANLLLARYTARRREMAVRGALGAARLRLLRQLLTESLVLGLVGGGLGIGLAGLAVSGLVALAPRELTRSVQVTFDLRILAIAVILSALTSVIFGLAPALIASRGNLSRALHEESHQGTGGGVRLRSWLVAGEVACSVILLAGAGLMFRTVIGLQAVDPGLNAGQVLTFRVTLPNARYKDPGKKVEFFAQAAGQLSRLPGVRSASGVSYLPFNGLAAGTNIDIAGRPPARPGEDLDATIRTVLPGYFQTAGIPLKQGRDFTAADNVIDSPYHFIINEAFARKYLQGEEPIGKSISAWMDSKNPFGDIIGVVGDVKEGSLDHEPLPTVYYIHSHLTYGEMVFVLRTEQEPLSVIEAARKVIHGLDRELPVSDVRPMTTVMRQTFARQQFSAVLLGGFSLASLLLAAIGIYGVLSYSVTQRTREIGVRVALGAEPRSIIRLIIASGARMVITGALIGIALAMALSGLIKSLLYGIGPRDPLTFVVAPAALIAVALMAAYVPARRAARVSPMEALRAE
ncbi:MAG TPA: ABC transporter permease [Candidatus Sulfotelmatobacter sp.]|nr:ABC transporter permease [Candidatus Sulfotelmatobacter sp.]